MAYFVRVIIASVLTGLMYLLATLISENPTRFIAILACVFAISVWIEIKSLKDDMGIND